MKERKSFKIDKDEQALLLAAKHRESELGKEQTKHNRETQLQRNAVQIKNIQRSIKDKTEQIKETNFTEKSELFIDGKKPAYLLQNEIDMMRQQIKEMDESDKKIKEEAGKNE